MHVALVGAGRLGRSLALLWSRAHHHTTLCGRGVPIPASADVIMLTVPDRSLPELARQLAGDERPVLHCSGARDLEVLEPIRRRGGLHPLMTFPGPEVALPELEGVPAAIAGSDAQVLELARDLALALGMRPVVVPGDRRLYHAAAVIAGNFSTVLLGIAARVLTGAGVPADEAPAMLVPLALTSLRNASIDPAAALTGPVARGDEVILAAHRQAMSEYGMEDLLSWFDEMVVQAKELKNRTETAPPTTPS